MNADTAAGESRWLPSAELARLFAALAGRGYAIVGPKVDQGAITYGPLQSPADLPLGWTEEQAPGSYRLRPGNPTRYFGFTVGPQSWKTFLFPPQVTVGVAERTEAGWQFGDSPDEVPRYAFLGVRACELAAIAVQDRTFLHAEYGDPIYRRRREAAFIVAVNCTQAASTCFCTSLGTGPRCRSGFDLALTEVEGGFVVETGSPRGQEVLAELSLAPAPERDLQSAAVARQQAVDQITRRLDTAGIRDLLLGNLDHARWDDVAAHCLSCTTAPWFVRLAFAVRSTKWRICPATTSSTAGNGTRASIST